MIRPLPELLWIHGLFFAYTAFLWVPVVFLAITLARRKVSLKFVFLFISIEAAVIWLAICLRPWLIT